MDELIAQKVEAIFNSSDKRNIQKHEINFSHIKSYYKAEWL